ncbi:MAG TPA: DUF4424 family protein [Rhizomicrobium sp.]|nr:DUF4424 family protein [Rhizomicrobium sp.]
MLAPVIEGATTMRTILLGALCLGLSAGAAAADDSSAALAAGGLVLTKQADIRMASEDLYLSPKEARVRYAFVNDGPKDIDTIVAFPMPDIDVREFWYEPLGTTLDAAPNFMGFALKVDGKPVEARAEERAFLDGRDVTAKVRGAGLPVNIVGRGLIDALKHLSPADRKVLLAAGLIEDDSGDLHPHWIAQTRFWWRQRFPAGKPVAIEHRYQPVTGESFFGDYSLKDKEQSAYNEKNYCIDAATRRTIEARIAAAKKANPQGGGYLKAYATAFVLKTANNWNGPIGRFHLTLDKLKPANVLSLCWDGALRKTGATTFEATRDNFAPARDLRLLVLE